MTRDELLASIGLDAKQLDPEDAYFAELAIRKDKLVQKKRAEGGCWSVVEVLAACTAEEKLEILARVTKQENSK